MRILIAEDEPKIAESLAGALAADGHETEIRADGAAALARLREQTFDLLILDLGLPQLDGMDVLRHARAARLGLPVLVLTARDGLDDRVQGLDAGADDYLVKPFALAEVRARVRALRRRGNEAAGRLTIGDLEIDLLQRRAWRAETLLDLTVKELEVLILLAQNAGQPVTREMLAKTVWNDVPRATSLNNVIDVHLARLRRKVDDPFTPPLVRTVRGVGFMLKAKD